MNNPEIMGFNRTALLKFNKLLQMEGFVQIVTVEPCLIELEFEDRYVTVTNYGRCDWFVKEPVDEQGKEDE